MGRFRKVRDDRLVRTTLQNPLGEVRSFAELAEAAQQERKSQHHAADITATGARNRSAIRIRPPFKSSSARTVTLPSSSSK